VRMTPALLERAADSPVASQQLVTATRAEIETQLQLAFEQGAEYALAALKQQQVEERTRELEAQIVNAREETALREAEIATKVEALHEREYRPPMKPRGCKEERDMVLECYQSNRGRSPGDIVFACEVPVNKLVECAELVRLATLEKIIPGSMPPEQAG